VLDLNPRVGAAFRLFAASNDADVVRALYADLTGRPLPSGAVQEGRRWLNEFHDLDAARRYIRDGKVTPLGYLRSLLSVDERVWWVTDDMQPALQVLRASCAVGSPFYARRLEARTPGPNSSRSSTRCRCSLHRHLESLQAGKRSARSPWR
jgi:hypothetical protein